jgi:dethiobiotin synthetase
MKQNGLFITGTDTDVGKTYIGSQIASLLYEMSVSVLPRKPIESGCELIDGALHPSDANHYYEAINKSIPLPEICPFRFQPAISPQRAARLAEQPITTQQVKEVCLNNSSSNDFLLVEGAGGFYSPLCEDGLNADLAKALQLPVLLIAKDQLGCINHILLTADAIHKHGLKLSAIILNGMDISHDQIFDQTHSQAHNQGQDNDHEKAHDKAMNNLEDLKSYFEIPLYLIAHDELIKNNKPLVEYLSNL